MVKAAKVDFPAKACKLEFTTPKSLLTFGSDYPSMIVYLAQMITQVSFQMNEK